MKSGFFAAPKARAGGRGRGGGPNHVERATFQFRMTKLKKRHRGAHLYADAQSEAKALYTTIPSDIEQWLDEDNATSAVNGMGFFEFYDLECRPAVMNYIKKNLTSFSSRNILLASIAYLAVVKGRSVGDTEEYLEAQNWIKEDVCTTLRSNMDTMSMSDLEGSVKLFQRCRIETTELWDEVCDQIVKRDKTIWTDSFEYKTGRGSHAQRFFSAISRYAAGNSVALKLLDGLTKLVPVLDRADFSAFAASVEHLYTNPHNKKLAAPPATAGGSSAGVGTSQGFSPLAMKTSLFANPNAANTTGSTEPLSAEAQEALDFQVAQQQAAYANQLLHTALSTLITRLPEANFSGRDLANVFSCIVRMLSSDRTKEMPQDDQFRLHVLLEDNLARIKHRAIKHVTIGDPLCWDRALDNCKVAFAYETLSRLDHTDLMVPLRKYILDLSETSRSITGQELAMTLGILRRTGTLTKEAMERLVALIPSKMADFTQPAPMAHVSLALKYSVPPEMVPEGVMEKLQEKVSAFSLEEIEESGGKQTQFMLYLAFGLEKHAGVDVTTPVVSGSGNNNNTHVAMRLMSDLVTLLPKDHPVAPEITKSFNLRSTEL